MNKNTVIIVDPFSTGALYAQKFHQLGYSCYAVCSNDALNKDYFKYNNTFFINPNIDSIEKCQNSMNAHNVLAVIIGSETAVIAGEKLAEYFKVMGNSPMTSQRRRDKFIMQDALKKAGLKHIQSQLIDEKSQDIFDAPNGYILKPVNSAGSDGVVFLADKKQVFDAIQNIDWQAKNSLGETNTQYILQSFESGDEFVVDMLVQNNNIFVASLCIYQKAPHNNSRFVYENMQMLAISDPKYQQIIAYAKQCIDALDVRFGAVHMEILATQDKGCYIHPVMIEMGARLHGGVAPTIFEKCYTPDLLNLSVNAYLNKDLTSLYQQANPPYHSQLIAQAKVVFLINQKANKTLNGSMFLQKAQSLTSHYQTKIINQTNMPLTIDLLTCPVLVCLIGQSTEQINADEQKLRDFFEECLI